MFVKYKIVLQLASMFILFCVGGFSLTAILTSCGHNVVTHSRGVGVDISWDGSSYIPNLRLGQWDVTNAVVKENMDVEANTITKADVSTSAGGEQIASNEAQAGASGGIQIKMKSGPQTNGYVKDVLTSETLSEHSVELAKAIYSVKSEMSSTGTKAEVSDSGEVKVEQNTAPIATTTTETKTESVDESGSTETKTTTTVTQIPVKEETQEAVQTVTESVSDAVRTDWWYYLATAAVAILGGGGVIGYLLGKRNKTPTTTKTDTNTSTADTTVQEETKEEPATKATVTEKTSVTQPTKVSVQSESSNVKPS